jgi:hypothetical protein
MPTYAQPSVYISYVSENRSWREHIASYLSDAGFHVWVDPQPDLVQRLLLAAEQFREQSRVYILLVSPHYLDSDEIHRIELPHIRSLFQTGERRIISVIVEPCPWQSFLGLPKPVVIPETGTPLSAGNAAQVKDALDALVREVRRAIQETEKPTAPAKPEEVSPAAQRVQSPSPPESPQRDLRKRPFPSGRGKKVQVPPERPPLALLFAARLTAQLGTGPYHAMATMLSPSLAVTPLHAMRRGILQDPIRRITIWALSAPTIAVAATIQAVDEERDFVALQLAV